MMKNDMGIGNFTEVLLFNRNRNWVAKLRPVTGKNITDRCRSGAFARRKRGDQSFAQSRLYGNADRE